MTRRRRWVPLATRIHDSRKIERAGWEGYVVATALIRMVKDLGDDLEGTIEAEDCHPYYLSKWAGDLPEDVAGTGFSALLKTKWLIQDGDRYRIPSWPEFNHPDTIAKRKERAAKRPRSSKGNQVLSKTVPDSADGPGHEGTAVTVHVPVDVPVLDQEDDPIAVYVLSQCQPLSALDQDKVLRAVANWRTLREDPTLAVKEAVAILEGRGEALDTCNHVRWLGFVHKVVENWNEDRESAAWKKHGGKRRPEPEVEVKPITGPWVRCGKCDVVFDEPIAEWEPERILECCGAKMDPWATAEQGRLE